MFVKAAVKTSRSASCVCCSQKPISEDLIEVPRTCWDPEPPCAGVDDDDAPPELQESESEDEHPHKLPCDDDDSDYESCDDEDFATAESENYFVHESMNPQLLAACREATYACMVDAKAPVASYDCDGIISGNLDVSGETTGPTPEPEVVPNYHYFAANARADLPRDTAIPGTADLVVVV